jgi:methyl-accepting chemotaxis protein
MINGSVIEFGNQGYKNYEKNNLNTMIKTLINTIVIIQQTAEHIHQVANKITDANELLGQRTEQHAAALGDSSGEARAPRGQSR